MVSQVKEYICIITCSEKNYSCLHRPRAKPELSLTLERSVPRMGHPPATSSKNSSTSCGTDAGTNRNRVCEYVAEEEL